MAMLPRRQRQRSLSDWYIPQPVEGGQFAGYLQITSSGSLFQTSNDEENILRTPAPAGDYRLTTRVLTTPTENYHGAALYIYQDDDNFIEYTRIYADGPFVALRIEAGVVNWSSYVPVTADDILLRLNKEGDTYHAWFSEDGGATWSYADQYTLALSNPQVGVGVRMGPTTTPLTANFDWIRLETIVHNTTWTDAFDLPGLDPQWSWVRENPALWSLTAKPGFLQITSSGSIYQTGANDQANILLTPAPAGDYRITAWVESSPTENYHGPGIFIYQHDDTYLEVSRTYRDGPNVDLRREELGVVNAMYATVNEGPIGLRIVKEGDIYSGWYSEDGATWNFIGQYELVVQNPQVGLSVRMGPTTTPVTADFDYFRSESYLEKLYLPLVERQ